MFEAKIQYVLYDLGVYFAGVALYFADDAVEMAKKNYPKFQSAAKELKIEVKSFESLLVDDYKNFQQNFLAEKYSDAKLLYFYLGYQIVAYHYESNRAPQYFSDENVKIAKTNLDKVLVSLDVDAEKKSQIFRLIDGETEGALDNLSRDIRFYLAVGTLPVKQQDEALGASLQKSWASEVYLAPKRDCAKSPEYSFLAPTSVNLSGFIAQDKMGPAPMLSKEERDELFVDSEDEAQWDRATSFMCQYMRLNERGQLERSSEFKGNQAYFKALKESISRQKESEAITVELFEKIGNYLNLVIMEEPEGRPEIKGCELTYEPSGSWETDIERTNDCVTKAISYFNKHCNSRIEEFSLSLCLPPN